MATYLIGPFIDNTPKTFETLLSIEKKLSDSKKIAFFAEISSNTLWQKAITSNGAEKELV